jgi:predicted metalloprotease with PDZ domain
MPEPAVRYAISIPEPATHLVHVVMEIDASPQPLAVRIPTWTPGSYLIREFARHVQVFRALDAAGCPLSWTKTYKDTWRVDADQDGPIRLELEVYANDLSVRTSHVDATHAFLNPSNVLPYVDGQLGRPAFIQIACPADWKVMTGLSPVRGTRSFRARDYDELVDCPIHAGPDPTFTFEIDEVVHTVATWGRGNLDTEQLGRDLTRIVETARGLFGVLPYKRYCFIVMLTDGARGGLEHRNSTAVMIPRFSFRPGRTYERALQLLAHEFFHTWNVKRIHPEALGPFDYSAENYTRLLWAMEGITEYYTSLLVRRADLITPERYLEIVGEQMSDLAETPGRNVQSLEEASFDAWIKYYRPDEHSVNSSVSYYLKGGLASLLLDLEMLRRTDGARSLDDLMRYLWSEYALWDLGVPEDGYQRAVEAVAGGSWSDFFDHAIRGRDDLAYDAPLRSVGLEVEWRSPTDAPAAWLGLRTRTENGRTRIASVLSSGPAHAAAISAGDELLALDGFRVEESSLRDRLRDYRPGDRVSLAIFRRDQLVQVPITLAEQPQTRAVIKKASRANVKQRTRYAEWLGAPW